MNTGKCAERYSTDRRSQVGRLLRRGAVIWAVVATAVVIALRPVMGTDLARPLLIFVNLIAAALYWHGRSLLSMRAHELRRSDHRAPVLLLRPFKADAGDVASALDDPFCRSFEEEIVARVAPIGPVVAIGDPRELFQRPGAARQYMASGDWQAAVKSMLAEATLVLVRVGETTPGFLWEIRTLLATCDLQRVYLVVSRVGWKDEPQAWEDFHRTAARLFPQSLPALLGWNCVIAFNKNGKPVALGDDGRLSSDPFYMCFWQKPWQARLKRAFAFIHKRYKITDKVEDIRVTSLRPWTVWAAVSILFLLLGVVMSFFEGSR